MITPVHLIFDLGAYFFVNKIDFVNANNLDLLLLFSSELIDLDHLFSKPIYHPRRNPFKTHFLHKNYRTILIVAILFIFYRPVLFLGIGLLSHLLLDYFYIKIYCLKDNE
ncbi:MAG: hypothetical protein COX30_04070 [Candidatus Moranbacteria bacterium CG23_combo_of_CG06-09_8_20_14_all_39_10]|nr:MAG: hypothetical protein COX30_04070 [Candidatus Moranbacteria bacterium CG23_combo_of_CG06-09_8_20_14_all_39_10]